MSARPGRPSRRTGNGSRCDGFTLIEILVATLLLLIAMAGIVPFFLAGLSHATASRHLSVATNIAREKMEEIRQLDYREIMEDESSPTDPANLSVRFGDSVFVAERNMNFTIDYEVLPVDGQAAKSVQVTVSWTAPPSPVTPAVVKTVIAEQYLGPKMGGLEVTPALKDTLAPGGTPFVELATELAGANQQTTLTCYIAESDWFLVYDNLNLPLPSPNDVSLKYLFRDNAGAAVGVPEIRKIDNTYLHTDISPGYLDKVYFQDTFDADDIPDGYWDLQATMYNKYDEPGNTWTLRVRVETGPPEAPIKPSTITETYGGDPGIDAIATSDETVVLYWTPGTERDRDSYVVERLEVDADGNTLEPWSEVAYLPSTASVYVDTGYLDPGGDSALDEEPCGRPGGQRHYQYRVYGVDTGGRYAPDDPEHSAFSAVVTLGGVTPSDKVTVPNVVGLLLEGTDGAQEILAGTKMVDPSDPSYPDLPGLGWSVTAVVDPTNAGKVLAQDPPGGTQVEQGSVVALTVAVAELPPEIDYPITFTKSDNPGVTIYVFDAGNNKVFSGTVGKHTSPTANLPNGSYNISLSASGNDPIASFTVNGASDDVPIIIPKK